MFFCNWRVAVVVVVVIVATVVTVVMEVIVVTVVIVVIAAVITPSGDPITLMLLAVPLILFYFISILIGYIGTRNRPVDA